MNPAIPALAKAAVGALIKGDPSGLAIAAAQEAVGQLLKWLPGQEKSRLDRLTAQVEGELETFVRSERIDLEPALGNATILFEAHGLSATELVDCGLIPERATEALLSRGSEVLKHAGDAGELCRTKIVPRVHKLLLNEPETITSLQPAITRALLGQREQIARLPDEVGAALRRMFGRHLLWHPARRWPKGRQDLSILRAEYGVVPFHPQREEWLKQILAWCQCGPRIAIRLITGPGGTGKTRLMLEACEHVPRSWRTGFLHPDTPNVPSWELDGLIDGESPILLVVDYAEEERKRTALKAILKYLRLHWSRHAVRLVLLTREESDWWPELAGSDAEVQDLVSEFPPTVDELPPLAERVEQRMEALRAAASAYAWALGVAEPDVAQVDVGGDYLAQALYLHMAALAATEGEFPHGEQELLDWVIKRERRFGHKGLEDFQLAQAIDPDAIRQALALATLAGGADKAEVEALLQGAPLLTDVGINVRKRVGELLRQLYP